MSKKSHHFLTLWPWPLTYDLEKLIRSGHYHYQCVYQIWEQSIPWFLSYRVNTIAGGGLLRRKTITSPDPSDTGDIIWDHHTISKIQCKTNFVHFVAISTKYVMTYVPQDGAVLGLYRLLRCNTGSYRCWDGLMTRTWGVSAAEQICGSRQPRWTRSRPRRHLQEGSSAEQKTIQFGS